MNETDQLNEAVARADYRAYLSAVAGEERE